SSGSRCEHTRHAVDPRVCDAANVPRRNRVDPWGDLHAVAARGLLTGNRGCVVDDHERVVRHHGSSLWIICLTRFRGWRWPLSFDGWVGATLRPMVGEATVLTPPTSVAALAHGYQPLLHPSAHA